MLKKVFLCVSMALVFSAHSQTEMATLKEHSPLLGLKISTLVFCDGEKFAMSLDPVANLEKYTKCVEDKKNEINKKYMDSVRYLRDKGYGKAEDSLKKLYTSINQYLNMPNILVKETSLERDIRRMQEKNISSAMDSNWSDLVMELNLAK